MKYIFNYHESDILNQYLSNVTKSTKLKMKNKNTEIKLLHNL